MGGAPFFCSGGGRAAQPGAAAVVLRVGSSLLLRKAARIVAAAHLLVAADVFDFVRSRQRLYGQACHLRNFLRGGGIGNFKGCRPLEKKEIA